MDLLDREADAHFSQPVRQILSMVIVLGLVGFGAYLAAPSVAPVFLANPYLNGFIAFVFVIGVLACFWQVLQLVGSVSWIEGFAVNRPGHQMTRAPRLLAPLAALLRSRPGRMRIGSTSARSILDSVATRIDEARDITRYITNLLIFLGLLGTFYGLATTVPALVETIRSLAPRDGEGGLDVFNRLMGGLEAQLGGMGVAFASSLLGLAGSLVVGLLELFASHGQNRFYRELEEWLSTITRVGFSSGEGEGSGEGGLSAVFEHMAGQMESLQTLHAQTEENRAQTDARLGRLTETLERLALQLESDGPDPAMGQLAQAQARLADLIERQMQEGAAGGGIDAESRMRLRSMDVQLLRILEEMSAGRQETVADLRQEIAQLTKAVRQASQRPADGPTPLVGRRG
ncbi:biopolymer transporter ExbB [Roseitranquillus sediminis]|uniref:biopolymer transporter ExbB n=1 Tax=Roseitranquillus sediminis TaxID=2809051 RepID=UPI001D0BF511|nr:biopolymer transporter ExbB [Roseitranquillus sediminis]MBM9595893.1 biopolymer transporter ExbB [Roseitranquillus sediminis]